MQADPATGTAQQRDVAIEQELEQHPSEEAKAQKVEGQHPAIQKSQDRARART